MNDFNEKNPQETPPPYPSQPQAPFGGAPVSPQYAPQRSSHAGFITCAVVLGFMLVIGYVVISFMGDVLDSLGGLDIEGLASSASSNTIAVVNVDGLITNEADTLKVIEHYRNSPEIRAVLVRINSPGGSVGGSEEVYEALMDLRESGKHVVASMGNVGASGGMYIACAAEKIYSNAGTLTGSIGVIMSLPNFEKISEKIGISQVTLAHGKFKDVPSTMRQMTDEERQFLQTVLDDAYDQFAGVVLAGREKALAAAMKNLQAADESELELLGPDVVPPPGATVVEYLLQIADGRMMTGRQAVRLGLVDEIGTKSDAISYLAKIAKIDEPEIYEYKIRHGLAELLQMDAKASVGDMGEELAERVGLNVTGLRLEYRMQNYSF